MTDDVVAVQLIAFPVAISVRADRHYEAIQREFALIHFSDESARSSVPTRLLTLVELTRHAIGGGELLDQEEIERALENGVEHLTVSLRIPRSAGDFIAALSELLVEADDFCQSGDLIMVAMPPDCRRFRAWFFEECVRQLADHPPRPWSDDLQ